MHFTRLTLLAAVVAMMTSSTAVTAADFEAQITVSEPLGVARSAEPVSGGIPLPLDQFKKGQAFALFDDNGGEVPLQVSPLVVRPNGTLRWVLLDFQTDLQPGQKRTFTLKSVAPKAAPASPLKVSDTDAGVTVDTGKVVLTVSKTRPFGLFEQVTAGGSKVVSGGKATYTNPWTETTFEAGVPESVEVHYAGPLRVTVTARGHFVGDDDTKLGYIARITAWAGSSRVKVKYSLTNSNAEHYAYRQISDSTVQLKLAGDAGETAFGTAAELRFADGDGWLHQGLYAGVEGSAKAGAGGAASWTAGAKDKPAGYVATGVNGKTIVAADLYFTDDPARKLAVAGDAMSLHGVTTRFDGVKDSRGRVQGQPFSSEYRWLTDSAHLSSFYLFDFDGEAADAGNLVAGGQGWLHAMAPPSHYGESNAVPVGHFGTQADELVCYEKWGWEFDPAKAPKGPQARGTDRRYIPREDNHYETEEDVGESLLLMYLRTGHRSYLNFAEAWMHYNEDLQGFRTDGWRYKDGGVWWSSGGPAGGNRPQRSADPMSGWRNGMPAPWTKGTSTKGSFKKEFDQATAKELATLANSRNCHCHNWCIGNVMWFQITGDRDALETAIDNAEQDIDTQKRAFGRAPGKHSTFSRDFTRASYNIHAVRSILPDDEFMVAASDYIASVFLKRPIPEPRGLVNSASQVAKAKKPVDPEKILADYEKYVGEQGIEAMKQAGVTVDPETGALVDPRTGAKWHPLNGPHTWMFPPIANAMDIYHRLTGDEDARDYVIAFAQAAARVLYQERHGQLFYGRMLADFPRKGIVKDYASWVLPESANKYGEGMKINGYLAGFWPDVCARGYALGDDPLLKQRAYDYWFSGSHRGYNAEKMHNLGSVGQWVNYFGVHSESASFTARTFYIWSHERSDTEAPSAVNDLAVRLDGNKATVTFTAPADKGGRVAEFQVKLSDKPLVDYPAFLDAWASNKDEGVTNWFMASNAAGEATSTKAGEKVSFTVDVPEGAKYFALRSFDDSNNRSAISNVAEAK